MRARPHEHFRMPGWMRWTVYLSGAGVLASGVAWLLLHHFVQVEGPFGPQPHALEHPALVVHGVVAVVVVWAAGLVWLSHVRRAWTRRYNRVVGGVLVGLLAWLALTGLGLYYLADEAWRALATTSHWVAGLLAGGWLPLHVWRGRRAVARGTH